jgi:type VI secretion system protein ImpC
MAEQRTRAANSPAEIKTEEVGLLDQILDTFSTAAEPQQRAVARDIVTEFARQVVEGEIVQAKDTEAMVKARIAQLDGLISAQLNEVMHAAEFQRLEAAWRGLHFLVSQTETGTNLKIKVFNVTKKELARDLETAADYDQSTLFKKVYEEEFGTLGGAPFGCMVGDYEIANTPQDLAFIEKMSQVAAAAHAPFLAAADPKLFGFKSFTQVGEPRDLAKIFDSVEYAKWKSFRESEDSRYVGLCVPHVLMRLPYGRDTVPVESFDFQEDVDGREHNKYLWGNAAYAMATRVTSAFSRHGWCTAIRGVEGGGLVEGLPTHTFRTDEGDVALKCPTEIAISDRREKELADAGFITLVHHKGRDFAAFFATQSANKAKKYDDPKATANARLSSQLQYMFAISRFAHYLKAIMRDKVGSFMSRKNCEDFLNRWISQYVLLDDDATQGQKAERPLREARVEVEDVPGKPGVYKATLQLKPHFQLDEIDVSLRLVAELPKGKQ